MISFSALSDEFEKIAATKRELKKFERKLEPGDILLTTKGLKQEGETRLSRPMNRFGVFVAESFGGPYHHAGIYTGKGKMVDHRPDGLKERPLEDLGEASVKVFRRPGLKHKDRKKIVKRMQSKVGEPYKAGQVIKVWTSGLRGTKGDKRRAANSLICTNVVADAYRGKADFGREAELVGPWDIPRSKELKQVAELKQLSPEDTRLQRLLVPKLDKEKKASEEESARLVQEVLAAERRSKKPRGEEPGQASLGSTQTMGRAPRSMEKVGKGEFNPEEGVLYDPGVVAHEAGHVEAYKKIPIAPIRHAPRGRRV